MYVHSKRRQPYKCTCKHMWRPHIHMYYIHSRGPPYRGVQVDNIKSYWHHFRAIKPKALGRVDPKPHTLWTGVGCMPTEAPHHMTTKSLKGMHYRSFDLHPWAIYSTGFILFIMHSNLDFQIKLNLHSIQLKLSLDTQTQHKYPDLMSMYVIISFLIIHWSYMYGYNGHPFKQHISMQRVNAPFKFSPEMK